MVKECPVILNNDAVTVVNFDGNEVQLPAINSDAKKVFILNKNGKYSVVDKDYKEASNEVIKPLKKKANKKTTFEENANDEVEIADEESPAISE